MMTIARKNDNAVSDTVNRIAQIRVATADPIPILAQMTLGPETARLVISLRIRLPDREIETISQLW